MRHVLYTLCVIAFLSFISLIAKVTSAPIAQSQKTNSSSVMIKNDITPESTWYRYCGKDHKPSFKVHINKRVLMHKQSCCVPLTDTHYLSISYSYNFYNLYTGTRHEQLPITPGNAYQLTFSWHKPRLKLTPIAPSSNNQLGKK